MNQEYENAAEEPQIAETIPADEDASEGAVAQDKPVKGNPFARLRILERENKVMAARFNDLMEKLSHNEEEEPDPEEEVEVPDFEANPLAHIKSKLDLQEKREKKKEKQTAEEKAREEYRTNITVANEALKDFMEQTPDYKEAVVDYLGAMEFEEAMDDNPEMDEAAVDRMMSERLNARKIKWIREGKNPGEELYKRAIKRGYKPKASSSKKDEPDAREEIAAEKKRASAGASIAKASGRASEGRVTGSTIAKMTDAEYREWADRLTKERGGGRIRMRDLLHDKIRSSH